MFRAFRSSKSHRELGASLIELVLFLPLIVTFILVVVDIGRAFSQYATLTWVAEEGARHASRTKLLETDSIYAASMARTRGGDVPDLNPVSPATYDTSAHKVVHARIRKLLQVENENSRLPLRMTNLVISSEHILKGTGQPREDTVRIQLSGEYESLFPLTKVIMGMTVGLEGIPVRTQVDVPYLF